MTYRLTLADRNALIERFAAFEHSRALADHAASVVEAIVAREVAAAKAEAWDEGYRSGFSNAMRRMSDEPGAPTTLNPHRAALGES